MLSRHTHRSELVGRGRSSHPRAAGVKSVWLAREARVTEELWTVDCGNPNSGLTVNQPKAPGYTLQGLTGAPVTQDHWIEFHPKPAMTQAHGFQSYA
jgi:hypothetical protein